MAARRTYGDRCGIARALDVIGDRWALLVVRELLLGPKRFTDLRDGLPSLGPDVLSQRLRDLEETGVLRRGKLAPPAASRVYELTERGRELEPILLALGRWGSRVPPAAHTELGPDAAVLALKTMFSPERAGSLDETLELRFGEHEYAVRVTGGRFHASRGAPAAPVAVIDTDPETLVSVLWHGRPAGELKSAGSRQAVRRFLRLFP